MTEQATAVITRDSMSVVNRISEFNQIAEVFSKSGLFTDVKSQAQAFVKILAGAEMGIPPFTAMGAFHLIQGKVTMSANAIAARIKTSGRYNYRVVEKNAAKCVIEFFENGKLSLTETWTADRASKAGTQNMSKYPDAMLFARCITSGARAACPEVIGSFYSPEEIGAVTNADGEIIDTPAHLPAIDVAQDAPMPVADAIPATSKIDQARERLTRHGKSLNILSIQCRGAGDTVTAEAFDVLLREARRILKAGDIATLHALSDRMKAAEQAHRDAVASSNDDNSFAQPDDGAE